MSDNQKRPAGTAAVLSFFFSGLGQLYNGQILKGLFIIALSSLSILVVIAGALFIATWTVGRVGFASQLAVGLWLFFIGIVSIGILGIYSIVDAYRTSLKT